TSTRRGIASVLISAALWSCGEPERPAVAQIGARTITEQDLKSYVLGLGESQKSRKQGPEARQDYLQPLIDYELMWLEAEAIGLDTSAAVQRQLERKVRRNLVAIYLKGEAVQPAPINEQEIEQRFIRRGLDRESTRLTWGIMTKTRPALEKAVSELADGAPFAAVAARHSITPDAGGGGQLGWLGIEATRRMGLPDSLFHNLPLGELSPILPHTEGFFVLRFTEEQPLEYFDFRSELLEELQQEKHNEALAVRAEQLAGEFNWRPQGRGWRLLLEKGRQHSAADLQLTPAEESLPLFRFDGGEVQVANLLYALKTNKVNAALADSAALVDLAERLLLQPHIFAAAARHRDLVDEGTLAETRQQLRGEVVLSELRRQKVVADIAITPEAMRNYYDQQTQRFYNRDQIDVAEVLLETKEGAMAVRQEIEAGADIADIARERSTHRGAQARGGIFPMEKTADLVPHILNAEPGVLLGPVELHDGFSVFEIVRWEKDERMPFEQVRRQIGDILRLTEERRRFQAYIEQLRQRYAGRIQVDQARLVAALPDDFLAAF
ncbi:MAG: peptidyl-prolyl cis-trans isomerase, partial [Candidatus Latescibacteria bacterium]|nr:peptidyl-prolyl cis-trans isomerase [Candidatus Latescibacterota bacterium]